MTSIASISAGHASQLQAAVSTKVAAKANDAMEQAGAAAISLLEQAADIAETSTATPKRGIDVRA